MIAFLFSLVLMLAVGILFTKLVLSQTRSPLPLTACLGTGAGIGIASCIYFLMLIIMPADAQIGWWIAEISLMVSLLAGWRFVPYFKTAPSAVDDSDSPELAANQTSKWLKFFFAGFGLIAICSFLAQVCSHPHSNWDALMIWNVRARFLERDPLNMANTFSPLLFWSHPDYPLLLPSIVSFGLSLTSENQIAPASIAFIFTMMTALLLATSVAFIKTKSHGLFAAMLLFTTPFWINCGASMLADVPIAFYFLSTIICLSLFDKERHASYLILAGLFASMAAWTKNEGLLFILCVIAASMIAKMSLKFQKRSMLAVIAGALPILLILIWFKMTLAPPNDLVAGQGPDSTVARLLNPSRYILVAQYFIVYSVTFGGWVVSPVPLLCLLWFILRARLDNVSSKRALLTVLFMLFGYAMIFLVTPTDLPQHLMTSADRLILQLWPMAILGLVNCFSFEPPKAKLSAYKNS
jgi:4-amino-4-deoxy-L-arabinose transferase-like glycosyltransferase